MVTGLVTAISQTLVSSHSPKSSMVLGLWFSFNATYRFFLRLPVAQGNVRITSIIVSTACG